MKCKYCHMPVSSNEKTLSRIELKFLERDVPELIGLLRVMTVNLHKISGVTILEKNRISKFVDTLPTSMPRNGILRSEFYSTMAGKKFFEVFLPSVLTELKVLNTSLKELLKKNEMPSAEAINKELAKHSERYRIRQDSQEYSIFDFATDDFLFRTTEYSEVEMFVKGFILAKVTTG